MSCDCYKRLPWPEHEPGCETDLHAYALAIGVAAKLVHRLGISREDFGKLAVGAYDIVEAAP